MTEVPPNPIMHDQVHVAVAGAVDGTVFAAREAFGRVHVTSAQ